MWYLKSLTVGLTDALYDAIHSFVWLQWQPKSRDLISPGIFSIKTHRNTGSLVWFHPNMTWMRTDDSMRCTLELHGRSILFICCLERLAYWWHIPMSLLLTNCYSIPFPCHYLLIFSPIYVWWLDSSNIPLPRECMFWASVLVNEFA